ncbi:hypothetical protein VB002_04650 [Campylobacter concisus]
MKLQKAAKSAAWMSFFEFLKPMAKNAIKIDAQAKDDGDIAVGASKIWRTARSAS